MTFRKLLCLLGRLSLSLRYRVTVRGHLEILARGDRGIVLLHNHPALVDPLISMAFLYPFFKYRPLADSDQMSIPVVRWLARLFNVIRIPDTVKYGTGALPGVEKALAECSETLNGGGNIIISPAGHIKRSRYEEIGAASGVETVLKNAPGTRVVIVTISGLWGSSLSRADGAYPNLARIMKKVLASVLGNAIFFIPRRPVDIELAEPDDFPVSTDRNTINRYLENYYNERSTPNTYVPYYFYEKGGTRILPEPERRHARIDLGNISETVKKMVEHKLHELVSDADLTPEKKLSTDLGMDSLTRLELVLWIEKEFGFSIPNPDVFETVSDVYAAAAGEVLVDNVNHLKEVPAKWFTPGAGRLLSLPEGSDIAEVFLRQADSRPDAAALADQNSVLRTYRELITGIIVLKPEIERIEGEYVGIMLPASLTAGVIYMTTLFAGKVPVMLNWTVGERNLRHMIELLQISKVLTSQKLVLKLESQGISFADIMAKFVFLETLAKTISVWRKLAGKAMSYVSWNSLRRVKCRKTAVVLFTSGSESLPKAVPLTHTNILANIRDILELRALYESDSFIGFLPPFHSFGLTGTILLQLTTGMRAVYHPNPTEGGTLAKMVALYRPTVLIGTPTFVNGILKGGTEEGLASLRLGVTGAEKCPEYVYEELRRRCPGMTILEGYGITECSPVVSVSPPHAPVPYSIGRPLASLEYVIINHETGRLVSPGEQGILLLRGPSVFNGYLRYDGPSPFVEFDGKSYYRTGDLVSQDENGILFFRGRLKRFVKLGGEMISLPAIEETLLKVFQKEDDDHPVLAVTSFGDDKPEIVMFTTRKISRDAANAVIREAGLSALHNIRKAVDIEEIPLLGTGKTNYRDLVNIQ